MVAGAVTTSFFFCRKFCIQSEKRFDFLKDLVSNVPELQGDMDSEGLAVASATPTELRAVGGAGVGRGRGQASTRPLVPGTGKRRGRPPKALGAPPSARTKSRVERFVDDEYPDCRDLAELGADTEQQQLRVPGYPPQHRPGLDRLQQQRLHYNKQFSSPFSSPRSEGGHYPGPGSSCPAQPRPPPPVSSSPSQSPSSRARAGTRPPRTSGPTPCRRPPRSTRPPTRGQCSGPPASHPSRPSRAGTPPHHRHHQMHLLTLPPMDIHSNCNHQKQTGTSLCHHYQQRLCRILFSQPKFILQTIS